MSGTALLVIVPLAVLFGGVAVLAISQIPQIRQKPKGIRISTASFVQRQLDGERVGSVLRD
jgi:hypothetical protein